MKIITLYQPWASLIALGLKQYETRHWQTNYRGKIAIHAAKNSPITVGQLRSLYQGIRELGGDPTDNIKFPLGEIVAIADLKNIYLIEKSLSVSPLEQLVGNWEYGRFAWHLENVVALPNPIPFRGQQGLKPLPVDLCDRLMKEIAA